uniref:Putative dna repair protein n=1 Tax=Ornithodoros turicata TaxID=34597 RepID=A0A2R5LIS6_9ACAR
MTLLRVGLCSEITAPVLEKLNAAGLRTALDVLNCSLEDLSGRAGIPYKVAVELRRAITARFATAPANGADLYDRLFCSRAILSSGSRRLDRLLGGGIYSGEVTEIVGVSGAGKTQMCHCLTASLLYQTANFGSLYVDTRACFSPQRVQQIVSFRLQQQKPTADLSRVLHVSVQDMPQMLSLVAQLRQDSIIQERNIRLVIVDSITSLFAPLLHGDLLSESLGYLSHLGLALLALAHHRRIAIVVTNDMVAATGAGAKPALGKQWAHVPSVSLRLQHHVDATTSNRSDLRKIVLVKSTREPSGEDGVVVRIGQMGITSSVDKG